MAIERQPDAAAEPAGAPSVHTIVREYRSAREYERDMRQRRRDGWHVVSVLQRPGPPARLRRIAVGSGLAQPETEYLVTYRRAAGHAREPRPLEWLLARRLSGPRSRSWPWLLLALVLVALLAYGLLGFFADAVPF